MGSGPDGAREGETVGGDMAAGAGSPGGVEHTAVAMPKEDRMEAERQSRTGGIFRFTIRFMSKYNRKSIN